MAHGVPRFVAIATFAAIGVASVVACVDLFHSTDFPTLCDHDAAACAPDEGGPVDALAPDAGPAEPIDLCASSAAVARRQAERTCAYVGACLGPLEDTRFGECMMRALAAFDCSFNPSLRPRHATAVLWDCLSKASTCEAVELCVFGMPAPQCLSGQYSACNLEPDGHGSFDAGSVLVECRDKAPAGMNLCTLRGRSCARVDGTKSICAGTHGASCTGPARCEDTFAVQCRSFGGVDADEGMNCDLVGDGRCVKGGAGVACAPIATAPTCSGSAQIVCSDGGVAESCVAGSAVQIDCAAIGQDCSSDGVLPIDPIAACQNMDAGAACADTNDDCIANTLVSCVRGTRFELECDRVPGLHVCSKAKGRAACSN